MIDLHVTHQYADTLDGWRLDLRRTVAEGRLDRSRSPLLIVPGYGMNSFIFSYHPRGTSMERCLAERGFEVWSMDLRGQGRSVRSRSRAGRASLLAYAQTDVSAAVRGVLERTEAQTGKVTLVGCSLGGSLAFGYLALAGAGSIDRVVAMGAPLRWLEIPQLVRLAFASPALAGWLRVTGTRRILRTGMPILRHVPSVVAMYMNVATVDMDHMHQVTQTVEDPDPVVNRDIARWVRRGELELGGVNVAAALAKIDLPLMLVVPNRDGIVPERTSLSAVEAWGGTDIEVLRVGTDDNWYAHANLFVANDCPDLVFEPVASWLAR